MTNMDNEANKLSERLAVLEMALRPQGVVGEIALSAVADRQDLTPDEIADVIMPPKQPGAAYEARWELEANAPERIKQTAGERAEAVFALAEQLGMRKAETLPEGDLARINPNIAIFMIEGGANRTSVVRREVAVQAMQKLYGAIIEGQSLYQFGSNRLIPRERNGQPNAEYKVAREIGGDHLPTGDSLTEFDLNMASALQAGYEPIEGLDTTETLGVDRIVWLSKDGVPQLTLIQPAQQGNGFKNSFSAMQNILEYDGASIENFQPVLVTNGQYRPKDELQISTWAHEQHITFCDVPIALGDEAGFRVEHDGNTITTGGRDPMVYVNEAVILHRLSR